MVDFCVEVTNHVAHHLEVLLDHVFPCLVRKFVDLVVLIVQVLVYLLAGIFELQDGVLVRLVLRFKNLV